MMRPWLGRYTEQEQFLLNFTLILSFYARRSRASYELRGSESKKAKLKELSNNISDRRVTV